MEEILIPIERQVLSPYVHQPSFIQTKYSTLGRHFYVLLLFRIIATRHNQRVSAEKKHRASLPCSNSAFNNKQVFH